MESEGFDTLWVGLVLSKVITPVSTTPKLSTLHLSLRNKLIPNNSYVVMDDIGSTDDTALLCHTNKPSHRDSEGDWFAPNGTKVGYYTDRYSMPRDFPGFGRTRSPHVVRLKRSSDGTPPEGVYKCVVKDTRSIKQAVYVGIYSLNGM